VELKVIPLVLGGVVDEILQDPFKPTAVITGVAKYGTVKVIAGDPPDPESPP